MATDKIGMIGIAIALLIVAIITAQSNFEPPFARGAVSLGCIVGAIVAIIILVKSD